MPISQPTAETCVHSFEAAALRVGLSVRTLRALAASAQIDVVQLSKRRVGITEDALRRFVESRTRRARAK